VHLNDLHNLTVISGCKTVDLAVSSLVMKSSNEPLTIGELLREVAERTKDLTTKDGRVSNDRRVAPQLTERNVRYYVTIGVVRPPLRDGNKSVWTFDHVHDLVNVRRAQHEGWSLKRISEMRLRRSTSLQIDDSWRRGNNAATRVVDPIRNLNTMAFQFAAMNERQPLQPPASNTEAVAGWAIRLSPNLVLSGFGSLPNEGQIASVTGILVDSVELGADAAQDNKFTNQNRKDNQ